MFKNYQQNEEPLNDPSLFNRGLGSQEVWLFEGGGGAGGGGDPDDPNDPNEEKKEFQDTTDSLDDVSARITPVSIGKNRKPDDLRSKFDLRLSSGKDSPRKLWSDISKKELTKHLQDDPALAKKVTAVFNENLGDELKKWGSMAKSGKPDRDTFLKEGKTIADVFASYDRQLENLAQGLGPLHAGAITAMREALRAVAASMSDTTKYFEKKGLWKKN